MKKLSLLLLTMTIMLFTGCKKDDNSGNGNENANETKPVPVTVTTTTNSATLNLSNLGKFLRNTLEQNRQVQSTSTTTANYEYDGRHITKVTSNVDNGNGSADVYVSTYYYKDMNKGLLDSIVIKKNNIFNSVKRYTIANDQIQQISEFDSNYQLIEETTFSNYNGDKPASLNIMTFDSNQTPINFSGTISYNGNDVSEIALSATSNGMTIGLNVTFTYDNKHADLLNVETLEMPIGAEHNPTTITNALTLNGSPYTSSTLTNTYSYNNDDYPISYTFTSVSSGTTDATGNVEIVYEDK